MYVYVPRMVSAPRGLIVPTMTGVDVARGSRVRIRVTLTNIGDEPGSFKITGFIYSAQGPTAADSYGDPSGYYGRIQSWIANDNTKGTAVNSDSTWLNVGASITLNADSVAPVMWSGDSHVYLVGTVTRPGQTQRLFQMEHYRFFPNAFRVLAPTQGPKSQLGSITVSQL